MQAAQAHGSHVLLIMPRYLAASLTAAFELWEGRTSRVGPGLQQVSGRMARNLGVKDGARQAGRRRSREEQLYGSYAPMVRLHAACLV